MMTSTTELLKIVEELKSSINKLECELNPIQNTYDDTLYGEVLDYYDYFKDQV